MSRDVMGDPAPGGPGADPGPAPAEYARGLEAAGVAVSRSPADIGETLAKHAAAVLASAANSGARSEP